MEESNPYRAPSALSGVKAMVAPSANPVKVVQREMVAFFGTTQIYRFTSPMSVENQLNLAKEFYLSHRAVLIDRTDRRLEFTRATTGFFRFIASNETKMSQRITFTVSGNEDSTERSCESSYQLGRIFEFFIPPHNLEIETGHLAYFSQPTSIARA